MPARNGYRFYVGATEVTGPDLDQLFYVGGVTARELYVGGTLAWERSGAPPQTFSGNISYTLATNVTGNLTPTSYTNLAAGTSISYSGTLTAATGFVFSNGMSTLSISGSVNVPNGGGNIAVDLSSNTLTPTLSAPVITTQPVGASTLVGGVATFRVVATGNPAPTYQWQRGDGTPNSFVNISGATSSTYNYTGVQDDVGDTIEIRVVVSNSQGSVTSNAVALVVRAAPMEFTLRDLMITANTTNIPNEGVAQNADVSGFVSVGANAASVTSITARTAIGERTQAEDGTVTLNFNVMGIVPAGFTDPNTSYLFDTGSVTKTQTGRGAPVIATGGSDNVSGSLSFSLNTAQDQTITFTPIPANGQWNATIREGTSPFSIMGTNNGDEQRTITISFNGGMRAPLTHHVDFRGGLISGSGTVIHTVELQVN